MTTATTLVVGDSYVIYAALHCTMQLASGFGSLLLIPYQRQGGNALAFLSL